MEVIQRRILLENSTDRDYNSPTWGAVTATTFYINVFLSQNIDDMGLFTDIEYFSANTNNPTPVNYDILTNKLSASGYTFPFMSNLYVYPTTGFTETDQITLRFPSKTETDYYNFGNSPITGYTDSKIEDLMSYDQQDVYKVGFDIDVETYTNYNNSTVNGVSRVYSVGEPTIYVIDTKNDPTLGNSSQTTGLQYADYTGITRNVVIDGIGTTINQTSFRFIGEGLNETTVSLSALTKEEYLFGVTSTPQVKNDIDIDRGVTSVMDMHLRLSEIKDLGELSRYGNGFYNLTKQ